MIFDGWFVSSIVFSVILADDTIYMVRIWPNISESAKT